GRTNLFDESAALQRVAEINRLKSKGYSLSLIREKLEQPNGHSRLNLGLEDETFSQGRHVLLIVKDSDEYMNFARTFVMNGLRRYEERLTDWVRKLPLLLVCVWMAPRGAAQTLLELQRLHHEFVYGDDLFVKA